VLVLVLVPLGPPMRRKKTRRAFYILAQLVDAEMRKKTFESSS
jgi:hypothetical protein